MLLCVRGSLIFRCCLLVLLFLFNKLFDIQAKDLELLEDLLLTTMQISDSIIQLADAPRGYVHLTLQSSYALLNFLSRLLVRGRDCFLENADCAFPLIVLIGADTRWCERKNVVRTLVLIFRFARY